MQIKCAPLCVTGTALPLASNNISSAPVNEEETIIASSGDDSTLVSLTAATNASVGQWAELMPANAVRIGATIQNKAATGNLFFVVLDSGLPPSGAAQGEIQIPSAPSVWRFDWQPKRRYVIRGDAASLQYSLNTW